MVKAVLLGLLLMSSGLAHSAEVMRLTAGIHDLQGEVIMCQAGQDTGIRIEGVGVQLRNVRVQDCTIAVEDRGERTVITGLQPQNVSVGFLLGGVGGWVESNTAAGLGMGFVLVGHQYTLLNNRSWDNSHLGYYITGGQNLLEGNEALRNGRAGIYVAWSVPGVLDDQTLLWLKQKSVGNILRGNTALDNGVDLAEVAPQSPGDCDENTWEANTFETSQLPAPCPPEEEMVQR